MTIPLKVLIIEDSDSDVALDVRALEKAGYKVTHEIVSDAKEMKTALHKQTFDLIISDHKLPQFDSLSALDLLKESGLDIPFIVVSGTIGEEMAVEVMKAGAHDYVMKGNLSRLGAAVGRELRDVLVRRERKNVEEALLVSEQNYRDSIENSPLGIRIVTKDGKTLYTNRALLDMYGYSSVEELEAVHGKQRYTPKSYDEHRERVKKRKRGEHVPPGYEISIVRSDGQVRYLSVSRGEVLWDGEKQFQSVYQDVTEHKQMEETLKTLSLRHEAILNAVNDIIMEVDNNKVYTWANRAGVEFFGEDVLGKEASFYFEDEQETYNIVSPLFNGNEEVIYIESLQRRKDGQKRSLAWWCKVIKDENGNIKGALSSARDITDRKQAEDEVLLKSKLLDNASDMILLHGSGSNTQILYVNEMMCQLLGYSNKELLNMKMGEIVSPEIKSSQGYKKRAMGDILADSFESIWVRKDGSMMPVSVNRRLYQHNDKRYVLSSAHDITIRKKAEVELLLRATLLDCANDSIILHDFDGNLLYVNEATCWTLGYTREELTGMKLVQIIGDGEPDVYKLKMAQLLEKGSFTFEAYNKHKDGTLIPVEIHDRVIEVHGNKYILGVVRNITERKNAEAKLHESESQYRAIFENTVEGIFQSTPDGKLLKVNPSLASMYGFDSPQEMITAMTDMGQQLYVNPEDRVRFKTLTEKYGFVKDFESEQRHNNGQKMWVSVTAKVIKDEGGNILYYDGTLQNITERKKLEEERKKSYQKTKKAMDASIQAIAAIAETRDPYTAGHQQRVAKLACAIGEEMGFSKGKIEGIRVAGILHDIGKINVPAEILSKPGKLSNIEMSLIKTHPQISNGIMKTLALPWQICPAVLQHHERMDGSGYPAGLSGKDIVPEARILMVADVVEAMASHRPYRPALGIDKALDEMTKNKGKLYDPDVVDVCLKLFNEKGFKFD